MHIELIDLLRCPKDHDETWLVAAFTSIEDRIVEEARLGCPVCRSSYPVHFGIPDFAEGGSALALCSGEVYREPEDAMRLAAFLNLARPGSLAILQGDHAALAGLVSELTQSRVIAIDPAVRVYDSELAAAVCSDSRIPLASGSADGLALSDSRYIQDAARVLRQGGRLLAPSDISLPPGLTEIARDESTVVAEAYGPVISLRRS